MQFTYPKPGGYDVELAFETQVLGLKSLHYGLWEPKEDLSLENLKKAQVRYTNYLMSFIPKGVKTILDVGCGIGDNAIALAKKGYIITSISPDPNHKISFNSNSMLKYQNISFIQSKFEDLHIEKAFDMILMSESSNYFPMRTGLCQVVRYLRPGGYVLLSGLFRKNKTEAYRVMNIEKEYVSLAKTMGLRMLRKVDISNKVIKTLQLGAKYYDIYALPAIKVLLEFYTNAFTWKAKLINMFFHTELNLAKKALFEVIPERLDWKKFLKYVRYDVILFQRDA